MSRSRACAWLLVIACSACEASAPARTEHDAAPPIAAAVPRPAREPEPPAIVVAPPDEHTYAGIVMVERVLGGASADAKLPLVVAIHGLGDDPRNFGHLFDTFGAPVRVLLPRGLDATEGGGWSWFPIRVRDGDVEGLALGIDHAADVLASAIAEAARARPTVGKPIVTGFSQGGMLSFAIAVDHPDLVAAALPVGGFLPAPLWPATAAAHYPSIDAYHGTVDRAVEYTFVQDTVAGLGRLGITVSLHSYEGVGHAIAPELHRDLDDRLRAVLLAQENAPR